MKSGDWEKVPGYGQRGVDILADLDKIEKRLAEVVKAGRALRESVKYCERMGVHSGMECAEWDRLTLTHAHEEEKADDRDNR